MPLPAMLIWLLLCTAPLTRCPVPLSSMVLVRVALCAQSAQGRLGYSSRSRSFTEAHTARTDGVAPFTGPGATMSTDAPTLSMSVARSAGW